MCVLITGWAGWPWAGAEGGGLARGYLWMEGETPSREEREDEAVVSADLQTNEHASERDGQPADLSFRLEVREKKKKKKKKERGKGGMRVSESE